MSNGNLATTPKISFPWFGVLLIILGSILLLDKLHVVDFGWGRIVWAGVSIYGIFQTVQGFVRGSRGAIFFGTVAFLYGVFFLLRTFDVVEFRSNVFLASTLLIVGAGFVMMYLSNFQDWFLLIPAVVFIGLGIVFVLAEIEYLDFRDIRWIIRRYWPVLLILLGVGLLFRRTQRRTEVP